MCILFNFPVVLAGFGGPPMQQQQPHFGGGPHSQPQAGGGPADFMDMDALMGDEFGGGGGGGGQQQAFDSFS